MKKHLFLIVIIGTLISFTACKKDYENKILGEWELTLAEGDIRQEEYISNHIITCIFFENTYNIMADGKYRWGEGYVIEKNKLYFRFFVAYNDNIDYDGVKIVYMLAPPPPWKISFSDSKKMTLQYEERKLTFKKIS